jgi:hypothetical protein
VVQTQCCLVRKLCAYVDNIGVDRCTVQMGYKWGGWGIDSNMPISLFLLLLCVCVAQMGRYAAVWA